MPDSISSRRDGRARLAEVKLPDFGISEQGPLIPSAHYALRYASFLGRLRDQEIDAAVVYADREHSANLSWLTGFDPRFEEALLIVVPDRRPVLLTGPENFGVAGVAPLDMDVLLYPPMGLMGQDRSATPPLLDVFRQSGLRKGANIGVCGWKYYDHHEAPHPQNWIEIPAYVVDTLRQLVGERSRVFNAGAIFMNPEFGLRAINSIDELARYEFAACHTSEAVKRVVQSTRPGMTEYQAAEALRFNAMPLSCHTMFSSGKRAWHGLLSPSPRVLEQGDAVTTAYGVQGALNCRAGWLAADAGDLPTGVQDYVDKLVAPYFEAVVEWLETIEVGVEGGALDQIIRRRIGDPFFGVHLNPGHLIHLEEWMHTPISPGSHATIRSGMAIQVDVIPATGSPYFTTNIEDGIVILDERGRSEFAEKYPGAFERMEHRRAFMKDQLGINLKPDCLPFSNIAGWLPPFWLSPDMAMTLR